jgi:adrenodoxin-NADP+ reductase
MYAAGWVAQGPVGVITSTLSVAYNAADELLSDHFSSQTQPNATTSPLPTQPEKGIPKQVEHGLKTKKVVDLESWRKIDQAEIERAKRQGKGKPREKFRKVQEMLAVLA